MTTGSISTTPLREISEECICTTDTSQERGPFHTTSTLERQYQPFPEELENLANIAIKLLNEAIELVQKDLAKAEKTLSKAQELRSRVFLALPEESSNYSDSIYQKVLFRCEEVELLVQRFRKAADDY